MVNEGSETPTRKRTTTKKAAAKTAAPRKKTSRPAPTIEDLLREQEARMRNDLALNRATFNHLGNRGSGVEAAVRAFFASHLPRQLSIGTGEIIDSEGRRSGQVDVAISNMDQPFTAPIDTACLHFAEGVNAAGEIKSRLTSRALEEALNSALLVKSLRPTPRAGDQAFTNPNDRARFLDRIPFFVLALEPSLTPATIARKISTAGWVQGDIDGAPFKTKLILAYVTEGNW